MPYRPDWENVLGPVVDYALTVPEIDSDKIVHFGYSLGGYLVGRYADYHEGAMYLLHQTVFNYLDKTLALGCRQLPK